MFTNTNTWSSVAALSSSEAADKPFKFGVTFKDGKTLYVTASETASENIADAVECNIASGKLACGKNQGGVPNNSVHNTKPMMPTAGITTKVNIDSNGVITASGQNFSIMGAGTKKLIMEPCSAKGHGDGFMFTPGVAKAYYV
jgi:hypothetical protein